MALRDTCKAMRTLLECMACDMEKAESTKAAAQRLRKCTLQFAKVAKTFRKESVAAFKGGAKKVKAAAKKAAGPKKAAPKKAAAKGKVAKKSTAPKKKAAVKKKTAVKRKVAKPRSLARKSSAAKVTKRRKK